MNSHHVFDNAHPAAVGGILATALPFDHISNTLWAVAGSVASWAAVKFVAWVFKKATAKKTPSA